MKNIGVFRNALGITQMELAVKLGVCRTAVTSWEADTSYPPASKLPAIAAVLGCSIDELFDVPAGAI